MNLPSSHAREQTPHERLDGWRRLHQPPLRRQSRFRARSVGEVIVGLGFLWFGLTQPSIGADFGPPSADLDLVSRATGVIPVLFGAGLILFSIYQWSRGMMGAAPVAALVLDRNKTRKGAVTVHLLLEGDRRRVVSAIGRDASSAHPGEIGWAFVSSGMLLGFERG